MCGIAGFLDKEATGKSAVGRALLSMAYCLQHRGADSAGVAVFDAPHASLRLQIAAEDAALDEERVAEILAEAGAPVPSRIERQSGGFAVFWNGEYSHDGFGCGNPLASANVVRGVEELLRGATVSAFGRAMRVHKVIGAAQGLCAEVEPLCGTHGIAHLRLATESRIDAAHAQPFWGRPFCDIAVTHNGHITNYHKLRRRFEARGFSFASHNDSEIIGVFLGDRMDGGDSLHEALKAASRDLDGSFSFIAATSDALGVARDPLATKPLLWVETDQAVALASEPQALYRVLGDDVSIREIKPQETRVWPLRVGVPA